MVAWMEVAARAVPEPADRATVVAPAGSAFIGTERELVRVLAGIALACVEG